jgi:hypothetical protein
MPLDEAVYCGECALEFTAVAFDPPAAVRQPVPSSLEAGSTQCARHARNAAVAACDRCGAFMCRLCRVDVGGKALCAACFDRVRADGSLEDAQTTFRSWRTLGLHSAVFSLFAWPLAIVIGPLSIYASIRGLAQSRKDGDERGAVGPILAIILAVLLTAGSAFWIFGIVTALSRARGVMPPRQVH